MLKTIKKVDEETWIRFKTLAARKKVNMAKLLKLMVDEYEYKSINFWNKILKGEKIISNQESNQIKSFVGKIRKEHGFRI